MTSVARLRAPGTVETRPAPARGSALIADVLIEVERELERACDLFEPIASPHEGKAVIEEELDELWEFVKENSGRSEDARQEAVQVAAMACRYVLDLFPPKPHPPRLRGQDLTPDPATPSSGAIGSSGEAQAP